MNKNNKIEVAIHIIVLYILPIALIAVCGFDNDRGIVSFLMSIILVGIVVDDIDNVKV